MPPTPDVEDGYCQAIQCSNMGRNNVGLRRRNYPTVKRYREELKAVFGSSYFS